MGQFINVYQSVYVSNTILGNENIEMRKMRLLSLKGLQFNGIKAKFGKAD